MVTKTFTLSDPNPTTHYLHRDRLGSPVLTTDETGQVIERHAFGAFGKPRDGDASDRTPAILGSAVSERGFTDHEHLDQVQLIHMNGRVYDYNLGRFYSVDPFIVDPANSQAINPYSYVLNNPLAATDPTGYLPIFIPIAIKGIGYAMTAYGVYQTGKEAKRKIEQLKNGELDKKEVVLDLVQTAVEELALKKIKGPAEIINRIKRGKGTPDVDAPDRKSTTTAGSNSGGNGSTGAKTDSTPDKIGGQEANAKVNASSNTEGPVKIPNNELNTPPAKRGNAPIGNDDHPVELHHRGQKPDSPLDEMTRTDHRGKDNFKKNHENTGQTPSQIDRTEWQK